MSTLRSGTKHAIYVEEVMLNYLKNRHRPTGGELVPVGRVESDSGCTYARLAIHNRAPHRVRAVNVELVIENNAGVEVSRCPLPDVCLAAGETSQQIERGFETRHKEPFCARIEFRRGVTGNGWILRDVPVYQGEDHYMERA